MFPRQLVFAGSIGVLAGFAIARYVATSSDERVVTTAQRAEPLAGQASEHLTRVVARVGDVRITVGDLQAQINAQPPYVRARYATLERKRELLDQLVRHEVQLAEAMRRRLDADPEVVSAAKQVVIQKLLNDTIDAEVKPEALSDEQLRTYYQAHLSEFQADEEVRVSAIRTRVAGLAAKVARLATGADVRRFRELVQEHGSDAGAKERGGDLGYFAATSADVPPEVVKAAFALEKVSDVAGPIASASGHYVIMLTGRRPALVRPFEQVKAELRARLLDEERGRAVERLTKRLRETTPIELDEAQLDKVRVLP